MRSNRPQNWPMEIHTEYEKPEIIKGTSSENRGKPRTNIRLKDHSMVSKLPTQIGVGGSTVINARDSKYDCGRGLRASAPHMHETEFSSKEGYNHGWLKSTTNRA